MPSKATHEIVKVVGGIAWLVGLILLFVNAALALLVLLIALILSVLSLVWTRQRRHDDLLEAAKGGAASAAARAPVPKDTQARAAELESLRAAGTISDDEYERKRQLIIDDI